MYSCPPSPIALIRPQLYESNQHNNDQMNIQTFNPHESERSFETKAASTMKTFLMKHACEKAPMWQLTSAITSFLFNWTYLQENYKAFKGCCIKVSYFVLSVALFTITIYTGICTTKDGLTSKRLISYICTMRETLELFD